MKKKTFLKSLAIFLIGLLLGSTFLGIQSSITSATEVANLEKSIATGGSNFGQSSVTFFGSEDSDPIILGPYRRNVTVVENAGIDRVMEPIDIHLTFEDGDCANAVKEVRVTTEAGAEIPRQIYNITNYISEYTKSCNVVFQTNVTAYSSSVYHIYYGNPDAAEPTYTTDLSLETIGSGITIENSYYEVDLATDAAWITSLRCKPYDPAGELLKAEWKKLLAIVTEIAGTWNGPWQTFDINTHIDRSGPVFIDVESVFGNWTDSGVEEGVANFRFYARVPWFTYSVNLTLTGADFGHLLVSSYFSLNTLSYAAYRKGDESLTFLDITSSGVGDILDWQSKWIDAENTTGSTDNPVGVDLIMTNGTSPWWTGWRNGGPGEIAPYVSGTLTKANLNLVIAVHTDSNYTFAQNMYMELKNPLTVTLFPKESLPFHQKVAPFVRFSLSTLYKVHLEVNLNLYYGSSLVVVFYGYSGEFEGNVTVWSGIPPGNVLLSANVTHPLGKPIEQATLVLTDDVGRVLRTLGSYVVQRDDLMRRLATLDLLWALGYPKSAIFLEIVDIDAQWPYAPPSELYVRMMVASDKVTYKPLQNVTIMVNITNLELYDVTNVKVRIEIEGSLGEQMYVETIPIDNIATGGSVGIQTTWKAPNSTLAGFVTEASLLDENNNTLAKDQWVFDVVEDWTLIPRYGFFSTPAFSPSARYSAEKVEDLRLLHINSLQFYDWFELHGNYTPTKSNYTLLSYTISRDRVIEIIELAQKAGMKSMPYTVIYSAVEEIYNQHTDWALTDEYGTPLKFVNWLYFMNPDTPSGWHDYLIDQFLDSMAMFDWDGIHLDQYGEGWTSDAYWNGSKVDMVKAFQHFINNAVGNITQTYPEGKLIFNYVTYWPECYEMMGKNTTVSALYVEVWEWKYPSYSDIRYLIRQGKEYNSSKAVILAAYPTPSPPLPTVLLLDAEIFANQGFHIELGEGNGILTDAYFPDYSTMDEEMVKALRSYYSCITRYGEYIYDLAVQPLPISVVQVTGYPYGISPSSNSIQVIPYNRTVNGSEDARIIQFVNFRGVTDMNWKNAKSAPTTLSDVPVKVQVPSEKLGDITGVYLINPDSLSSDPTSLAYTVNVGENTINFTLPSLKYWDIIIIKYSNSTYGGQTHSKHSTLTNRINSEPYYFKLAMMVVFPLVITAIQKREIKNRKVLHQTKNGFE